MSKRAPITDMLNEVAQGGEWHSKLVDYFWSEMTARVEKHLSSGILSQVGADDVYLEAIRSALSEVAAGRVRPKDRDEFRNLLVVIVDRKRRSAAKRGGAKKRSVGQTKPLVADVEDRAVTPADQAMAQELVEVCWAFCLRGDTGQQRDAAVMGILGYLPAVQIQRVLAPLYGENEVPSVRSIQAWVKAWKAALGEHLKEKFGPDVEPS